MTGTSRTGSQPGGVHKYSMARSDLRVTSDGVQIEPALARGSWLAFKPSAGNDAVAMGDLVLIEQEYNGVIAGLQQNGNQVVSVHNRMLDEEPRLFFMHYWANDDTVKLARGLRAALVQTNTAGK